MGNKEEIKYVERIEDMNQHDLHERIRLGMNFKIENPILAVPYLGGEELVIEYSYPELLARCPMTGVKDLYKIRIKYIPNKLIPELKSLKKYFWGYETLPISHEHIIAKVYKEIKNVIKPKKLAIVLYVAARGEFKTTICTGNKELLNFSRPLEEEHYAE